MLERLPTRVPDLSRLACPACHQPISVGAAVQCSGCGQSFPQRAPGVLSLLPAGWASDEAAWRVRQTAMESDYRTLVADPAHTELAYRHDFGAFRERLQHCRGRVLDVGGGNGLLRHFLPARIDYTVVDPAVSWFDPEWRGVVRAFPRLAEPLSFVCGVAEALPFADETFDWVLGFWSLNHVGDPPRALRQLRRVLRPDGRALIVLEDMRPDLSALLSGRYRDHRWGPLRTFARWAVTPLHPWPLQADHVRITEAGLAAAWAGVFEPVRRDWFGSYLALELAAATS